MVSPWLSRFMPSHVRLVIRGSLCKYFDTKSFSSVDFIVSNWASVRRSKKTQRQRDWSSTGASDEYEFWPRVTTAHPCPGRFSPPPPCCARCSCRISCWRHNTGPGAAPTVTHLCSEGTDWPLGGPAIWLLICNNTKAITAQVSKSWAMLGFPCKIHQWQHLTLRSGGDGGVVANGSIHWNEAAGSYPGSIGSYKNAGGPWFPWDKAHHRVSDSDVVVKLCPVRPFVGGATDLWETPRIRSRSNGPATLKAARRGLTSWFDKPIQRGKPSVLTIRFKCWFCRMSCTLARWPPRTPHSFRAWYQVSFRARTS